MHSAYSSNVAGCQKGHMCTKLATLTVCYSICTQYIGVYKHRMNHYQQYYLQRAIITLSSLQTIDFRRLQRGFVYKTNPTRPCHAKERHRILNSTRVVCGVQGRSTCHRKSNSQCQIHTQAGSQLVTASATTAAAAAVPHHSPSLHSLLATSVAYSPTRFIPSSLDALSSLVHATCVVQCQRVGY